MVYARQGNALKFGGHIVAMQPEFLTSLLQ